MEKAIIFGAGSAGEKLYAQIAEKYDIVAFTDNDVRKVGNFIEGIKVISPEEAIHYNSEMYVIATMPGRSSIIEQLSEHGIGMDRIDDSYVIASIEARRCFLECYAKMLSECNEEGSVAEAGVFEGDFAKYINEYFPDKILHLFDTFEGFDTRDIRKEKAFSKANEGDYNRTSIELVMSKMKYPDYVRIHKGFFPDTTKGIDEKFCFVNLDLDLYEPTYAGLKFFGDRLTEHGVILVHDYFATDFKGPKAAVDRYVKENGVCRVVPIGDGLSVMVVV